MSSINTTPGLVPDRLDEAGGFFWQFSTLLHKHIVEPVALIAMVASLMFYLADLRAVFLPGTIRIKVIGFLFVVATVLTSRYGLRSGRRARQWMYTAALAFVTYIAMTIDAKTGMTLLANAALVIAVWRFATKLSNSLAKPVSVQEGPRILGRDRVRIEKLIRDHKKDSSVVLKPKTSQAIAYKDPSQVIVKLVALALLAFALGEPLIMYGSPEIGQSAMMSVVVFLFASGLVMVSASVLALQRRLAKGAAQLSPAVLPMRLFSAVALLVLVLSVGLAVPGIHFRGSGSIGAKSGTGGVSGSVSTIERQSSLLDKIGQGLAAQEKKNGAPMPSPGTPLIASIAALGKLLLMPAVVLFAIVFFFVFIKLGGFKSLLTWSRSWNFLAALRDKLRRHRVQTQRSNKAKNPFAGLARLERLSPKEAVIDAYGRWLIFCEQAGHKRPERSTPNEYLASLLRSAKMRPFRASAKQMTELYIKACYSGEAVEEADRSEVIQALGKFRELA